MALGVLSGHAAGQATGATVYVGSDDGNVYAMNAGDGTEQWAFETGDWVVSSPTVDDGTVYVGSFDANVYAMDAGDGTEQWAFETGYWVGSSPTEVDGTVYVGSDDANVYALDAGDGTEQWAFETGTAVSSSPTVVQNPASGNTVGSRVQLGTLGHHGSLSTTDNEDASDDGSDGSGPGFGLGAALTGLGGAGYLVKQRITHKEDSQ